MPVWIVHQVVGFHFSRYLVISYQITLLRLVCQSFAVQHKRITLDRWNNEIFSVIPLEWLVNFSDLS